ncbi:hypothetical protein [Streptomyces sp. S.PB5]|uniref:hypothetical protein n=1 Tax=Streptomyces sp. S.PB5 TaxID=3020844 RepID=UPI0025AF8434|nr:hypothetical protein [Streptomyces sp. S.PB5]MDN3029316.1 hypothetical protein [Streptomyces sp. S.PB5]
MQVEHLLAWQVLEHDMLFGGLREPSKSVPVLDAVAALAPADCEFVMTTAVREAVAAGTGLSSRLGGGSGPCADGLQVVMPPGTCSGGLRLTQPQTAQVWADRG